MASTRTAEASHPGRAAMDPISAKPISTARPERAMNRAAAAGESIPRDIRTWSSTTRTVLSGTMTPTIACGARVCRKIHSGSTKGRTGNCCIITALMPTRHRNGRLTPARRCPSAPLGATGGTCGRRLTITAQTAKVTALPRMSSS